MAAAGAQHEEEDIEFPAISPAPVLIALLNLVQALVIWVVAVAVHCAALPPVQQAAAHHSSRKRTDVGKREDGVGRILV